MDLQLRFLSSAEASTSFAGGWPCTLPRRRGRQRYKRNQALPQAIGKDRPAALQAPAPATSISSAQQPSPVPVGFLRPVTRDRLSEPLPLLPLHQHAPDTSKGHSDSPSRSTSYKPLRASAPLITKRIKQTKTWQQLEALVLEESRNFNHVHASAALLHLTKLLQGPDAGHSPTSSCDSDSDTSLHSPSLSDTASSRSTSSGDLSRVDGHAMSLHALEDPIDSQQQQQQPQQQQQQEAVLRRPDRPDPSPVSWSSRPTSSINLAQQPPRVLALLHTLLRIVRREMPAMDVQGVSNTLYSLAVLRWPDMSLVGELMAAVQYRLDMSRPQNLANIIWSCVVLGYMPERDWMVMYYRALDLRLPAFGPVDVSNTVWAFGRLQFNGKQYRVAPDIVRKLLQQAYSVLPQLEPQHLANTLWGLARLGFVPGPMWSQAFLNATGPKLLAMHAHELCSLAWAVGKLRMAPAPVWVSQLLLASQPMLHKMQPHQLSQLLLGLASLNARPPSQWMAAALRVSQQHTSYYSPTALLQVLRGVGQLGGPSAAGFSSDAAEQWLAQHLQAASAFIGGGAQALSAADSYTPNNTEDRSSATTAAAEKNGYVDGNNGNGSEKSEADVQSSSNMSSSSSRSRSTSAATWTADASAADVSPSEAAPSELEEAHEGDHAPAAAGSFNQAEELAQLLYALVRMHARPPGWWLGQVLQAFQHTPGMMHTLSRDGPATAMTVWSLRQLLPGSLTPTHTAAAADTPSAITTSSTINGSSSSSSNDGASPVKSQHVTLEKDASPAWQRQEPRPPSRLRQHQQQLQQQQQPARDQMLQSSGVDEGREGRGEGLMEGGLERGREGRSAAAFGHHLLPFLTSLFKATGPRLQKPTYTALELATLLHAMAGWGVTPPGAWMVRFWWRSLVLLSNTRKSGSSRSSSSSKGKPTTRTSPAATAAIIATAPVSKGANSATAAFSHGTTTVATPSGVPLAMPSAAPVHTAKGIGVGFSGRVGVSGGVSGGIGGVSSSDMKDSQTAPARSKSTSSASSSSDASTSANVSSDSSIRSGDSRGSNSSSSLRSGENAFPGSGSNKVGLLSNGSGSSNAGPLSSMGEGVVVSSSSSSSSSNSGSREEVMNPFALDMMLKALVKLRARPQEQWSRALLQASRVLLPLFAPHQFGSVLSSLAALGIKPGQGWQQSCLLESYRVWSRFTPSDWVSMLCGLAKLEVKVPSDWLSCFFSSTTQRLASFSVRELALLGTALCWLRARFPPTWSSAFLAAALPKLSHANPADLLRLVTSAIHLLPDLTPLSTASPPHPDTPISRTPAKLATLQPTPQPPSNPQVGTTGGVTSPPSGGSAAMLPSNELRRLWLAGVVAAARSHVEARSLRGEQQRLLARALRQMARVSQRAACQEGKRRKGGGYTARREGDGRPQGLSAARTVKGRTGGGFKKGQVHKAGQDNSGKMSVDQNSAAGSSGRIGGGGGGGGGGGDGVGQK